MTISCQADAYVFVGLDELDPEEKGEGAANAKGEGPDLGLLVGEDVFNFLKILGVYGVVVGVVIGEEGFGGNVLEVASVGGRLPLAGADGFSQIRLLKNGRYSPITFLYFSSCTSITIYYKTKPNSSI